MEVTGYANYQDPRLIPPPEEERNGCWNCKWRIECEVFVDGRLREFLCCGYGVMHGVERSCSETEPYHKCSDWGAEP